VRITLHTSRSGGTLMAMFLIVAAVGLLAVGGCVAHRVNKKVQRLREQRERQLTNELNEASLSLQDAYRAGGGTDTVRAVGLVLAVPAPDPDNLPVVVLEASGDFVTWKVAGTPEDLGPALGAGFTNGVPARFFRLRSQ
jgi:hypothetical protein